MQLTLGDYDPVIAVPTTLMQMSSVLEFIEAIDSSRNLVSWSTGFSVSSDLLPEPLDFSCSEWTPDSAMAGAARIERPL